MRNYFNKLHRKIIRANNFLCSESPWHKRNLSPILNLDIKDAKSATFDFLFLGIMFLIFKNTVT